MKIKKTFILRKPKFMRSDRAMAAYVSIAASIGEVACREGISSEEQYEHFKRIGECYNKAAKAGGFFSTTDFIKWLEYHRLTQNREKEA